MTPTRKTQIKRIVSWTLFAVFALGFFYSPIGFITGPILGLWLVGTQRPLRGVLWLFVFGFFPHLVASWKGLAPSSLPGFLTYAGFIALATLIGILPFLFHRLTHSSLPGALATLPFPLAVAVLQMSIPIWLPASAWAFFSRDSNAAFPALKIAMYTGVSPTIFYFAAVYSLGFWIPSILVWIWNREFRPGPTRLGLILIALCALFLHFTVTPRVFSEGDYFFRVLCLSIFLTCLLAVILIGIWAFVFTVRNRRRPPLEAEAMRLLRSPGTFDSLRLEGNALVSPSGARFPLRRGIPDFRTPEDLTGLNGKYNRLYQWIGGFYDDIQRVVGPMQGFDRDAYVHSYMDFLEVKPGDRVLETSVGTALNFKYLPKDIHRYGLDLSDGMLDAAQTNLARWGMDANLVLGNAERLPYADESFDVVFHVGGINFFSDRAAAIREMIRVARPGSKLLIADETEEHVQAAYEKSAITSAFYSNREEAVKPPIDLLPPKMEEVHLEILNVVGKNRFYALTFRKPHAA
ncbi:MAG: class I SAM-dependent methyltransferase [Terracidiphilus sp.]